MITSDFDTEYEKRKKGDVASKLLENERVEKETESRKPHILWANKIRMCANIITPGRFLNYKFTKETVFSLRDQDYVYFEIAIVRPQPSIKDD